MSGTVIFNDIGDNQDDEWPPNEGVTAQSFTSGSGTTTITDVKLSLMTFNAGEGGTVDVELFSDSSTRPGSELATLGTIATSSLTGSFATYDFAVTGAPDLTADTRYWIEVTSSVDNVEWAATFSTNGTEVGSEFQDANGNVLPDSDNEAFLMSATTEAACYAAGTRILTARGEVPVEALRPGDRAVTARHGVGFAPVRWVGRRRLSPSRHPLPASVNPVRIRAGALGPDRPHRDLILSPDHALFLDGVLVRARELLNGATIVQEAADDITYFHVELDRHGVLLAEGAAAESFLDTGNRAAFENGGATAMAHPDFARAVWATDACAELVYEGPRLAAVRDNLIVQAGALGWSLTDDPGLTVEADGRTIRPVARGAALQFDLPGGTETVRLLSRCSVPAETVPGAIDTRVLGVAVTRLALDGSKLPLDGEALGKGWLAAEPGLRWTSGNATLRAGGAKRLRLRVAPLLRYWIAPGSELAARAAA